VTISRPDVPFDGETFRRIAELRREKLSSELRDASSEGLAESARERLENLEEDLVKSLAARESRWRYTYTSDGERARLDGERISPPFRLMSGNRYRPPEQHWLFDGAFRWHVQTATDAMRNQSQCAAGRRSRGSWLLAQAPYWHAPAVRLRAG